MRLGVDTGGTFTDFVWLDDNGRYQIHKQLSTPTDPSSAILEGIVVLNVPDIAEVVHGSTVATNALLERRGARTALITTKGFGDVLAIGRQNRPDLYALVPHKPDPLVPPKWCFEVEERITAQGDVLIPLNTDSLDDIFEQLAAEQIESVAICLLFSFLRPEHERQIRQKIELQSLISNLHISLSSDILPEYREYERTATTVINAYVAPLMRRYLRRLAGGVAPRRLSVMQSNGGIITAQTAGDEAARTVLSGPAGGVVGAQFVAALAGFPNIITFDTGGTSSDVALCPAHLPTTAVGEIAGMPLRLPIIDIHTVGAGGGSLAYVDAGGALHVGPQSAGADPGPACYGNKSIDQSSLPIATVTDANLMLGRLDADHFLGGSMVLDKQAAQDALSRLAEVMGADSAETAAWGVIQVANANMERAVRRISVERGHDPRRFTLVAFGGAGPLHACDLATNLQIPRVLLPRVPGVLSALGMLTAVPTKDFSQTVMWRVSEGSLSEGVFAELASRAVSEMVADGYLAEEIDLRFSMDMRYVGQSHELNIAYSQQHLSQFHQTHEQRYGYHRLEAGVEVVTLRVTAVAPVKPPQINPQPLQGADASHAHMGEKMVWFDQEPIQTQLYVRDKLQPGNQFTGPAIVFQYDTTTVIPPGWATAVDAYGNLLLHM